MATCAECGTELSFLSQYEYAGARVCGACHTRLSNGEAPRSSPRQPPPAAGPDPAAQIRLTTLSEYPGAPAVVWFEMVQATVVQALETRKDLLAGLRHQPGARGERLEAELARVQALARDELRRAAARLGAEAVVGVTMSTRLEPLGGSEVNERLVLVDASGTAVKLTQ
ncbi:YbjQ family protein [Frigidibacter sp. ROC022]|uniref:YbjQ family protein n=1 Tax=Frigidibacter sp. ROC022 TaxID=2971796 RepID=UPI00215B64FB|nr:YbjQ family protein [Frigidibacter sp. ROC022]MCR8725225.1 YbjQ family protein [Frigidibacter sp. ROC022]